MNKTEKKIFWGFTPFDYRSSESLFEKMSLQGWLIDSVTPYYATFKAAPPKKRKFRAAIYSPEDVSEHARSKYIEQWKKLGMKYACDCDFYFWFYTEEDTVPVEENILSNEKRLLYSAVWRKELYGLLLLLLAIGFGAIQIYNVSYISYITFSNFAKLMLLPIFAPLAVLIILYACIWMFKYRKMIRSGTPLPKLTVCAAKFRRILVFGPVLLFFGLLILALILDACTGYAKTILLISPIALVGCVAWGIRALKKKGFAVILGRILIVAALVVCIAVYAFGNFRDFSSGLPEGSDAAQISAPISKESYIHTASPAVKLHYTYKVTGEDGSAANTEYFMCTSETFADRIYAHIEETLREVDIAYTLERNGKEIVYKEYHK